MIPIKIGGKPFKIKPINSLITREFVEVSKIKNLDLMKYIAWFTGVKNEDAFFAKISNTVVEAIGQFKPIEKMPFPNTFDKRKLIETIGQRHQIERCKKKDYELLIYILAVSQAQTNDTSKVNEMYESYLEMPYVEVLPAGFFFYKNLKTGSNLEMKSFVWRRWLKKIKSLRSRPESKH